MSQKPKPFSTVAVTLSREILDVVPNKNELFQDIKRNTKTTSLIQQKTSPFIIEGEYDDIKKVHAYLEDYIETHKRTKSFGSSHENFQNPDRATYSHVLKIDKSKTERSVGSAEKTYDMKASLETDNGSDNFVTIDTNIFSYIKHVYGPKLADIKDKNHVEIVPKRLENSLLKLTIQQTATTMDKKEDISKAKDEITTLYQSAHSEVNNQGYASIKCDAIPKDKRVEAGAEIQKLHPLVYAKLDGDSGTFHIYGKAKYVESAEQRFRDSVGLKDEKRSLDTTGEEGMRGRGESSDIHGDGNTRRGRHGRAGRYGSAKTTEFYGDPEDYTSDHVKSLSEMKRNIMADTNSLTLETSKDVSVHVYRGDLVKEDTNAIVNAANEDLKHIGGLALAIRKAAGYKLDVESEDIISREGGRIGVAQIAVTQGYNLTCQHIIHAVVPRWHKYPDKRHCQYLLKETFLKCLRCADKDLQIKSIAVPAISSGIFGVPKNICAAALYDAVEEFCSSKTSMGTLKEIKVVNIDPESTNAISLYFLEKLDPEKANRMRDQLTSKYGSSHSAQRGTSHGVPGYSYTMEPKWKGTGGSHHY